MIQMALFNPDPPTKGGILTDEVGRILGDYTYLTSEDQELIDAYCDDWLESYEKNPDFWLTVDLETGGLDFKTNIIWLIGIAFSENEAVVICPNNVDLTKLKEVLNTIPLSNHNIKYDCLFLKNRYGVNPKIRLDTMIGGQIEEAGIADIFSLETMAVRFDIGVLNKRITMEFTSPNFCYDSIENRHTHYAGCDAVATYKLAMQLEERMKANGLWDKVWVKLDRPTLDCVTDIEFQGVPIAIRKVREIRMELEKERETAKAIMESLWTPFSHTSPKQLSKVLNERCRLRMLLAKKAKDDKVKDVNEWVAANKDGYFAEECELFLRYDLGKAAMSDFSVVDKKVLSQFKDDPLIAALLQFRELEKLIGTYLIPWEHEHMDKATGLIHPNFKVHGAETGRLSCSEPNVQNIPGKFREFFAAPRGQRILTLDYSQYELRVYAVRSKEGVLIESYNRRGNLMTELRGLTDEVGMPYWETVGLADQKEPAFLKWLDSKEFTAPLRDKLKYLYYEVQKTDMHRVTASKVFKIALEEVTSKQRSVAKTLNFAILYGSSPNGIADQLKTKENIDVSADEAKKFVEDYHKAYPAGSRYIREMHRSVVYPGYTETIAGRRRQYQFSFDKGTREWQMQRGNFEREAMNYSIQAVNADVTKRAMGRIYPQLAEFKEGARLIMQIHDELVALSPTDRAPFYVELIEREMIEASDKDLKGIVPTEVGIRVGSTWSK